MNPEHTQNPVGQHVEVRTLDSKILHEIKKQNLSTTKTLNTK